MLAAVSPYHVTTHELPLMAALLLAERVVTLLPVPPEGVAREDVRKAVVGNPRYFRLLDSWRWTTPLWRAGVVSSVHGEADAIEDVRACNEALTREEHWKPMRPFLHPDLLSAEDRFLDRVCADMLKGGPDPGVSVPIVAGLDAFASRHGLVAIRAGTGLEAPGSAARGSVAQRAESRLGETLFSAAMPILTQASAETVLRARKMLAKPLQKLHAVIDVAVTKGGAEAAKAVREAAKAYAAAFESERAKLLKTAPGETRTTAEYVTLTCRRLPLQAAAMSSVAAVRHVSGQGSKAAVAPVAEKAGATVTTIIVNPMSVTPV